MLQFTFSDNGDEVGYFFQGKLIVGQSFTKDKVLIEGIFDVILL
jgi:hypothetical protein